MGMKINRRDLLFASELSLLAGTRASGQGSAPPRAQSGRRFKLFLEGKEASVTY